jgi:sporulation-control protein spo0M
MNGNLESIFNLNESVISSRLRKGGISLYASGVIAKRITNNPDKVSFNYVERVLKSSIENYKLVLEHPILKQFPEESKAIIVMSQEFNLLRDNYIGFVKYYNNHLRCGKDTLQAVDFAEKDIISFVRNRW